MANSSNEYIDGAIEGMKEFLSIRLDAQNDQQSNAGEFILVDIDDAKVALEQLNELKIKAQNAESDLRFQVDEIIKSFNLQFG